MIAHVLRMGWSVFNLCNIATTLTPKLWLLLFAALLPGCGASAASVPLPTARISIQSKNLATAVPTPQPTQTPTPIPAPTSAATTTPDSPQAQYRLWMEEARTLHPYSETVEHMWAVMLCESGGQPNASNGVNHGLFQFSADTWAGAWNAYRDQPILDPRAQIFATAQAWQAGYQSWWGCYFNAAP